MVAVRQAAHTPFSAVPRCSLHGRSVVMIPVRSLSATRSSHRCTLLGRLVVVLAGVAAPAASATVRVSRAELSGTRLRVEGTAAPNSPITVDGTQMTTSDGPGNFRAERDPFAKPADCRVAVND